MSIKALNWAWGIPAPTSAKLVLLCLADHADNDGVCWPGHTQVSEKTGVSERHIIRLIDQLAERRLLQIRNRKSPTKRQMANVYLLNLDGRELDVAEQKPGDTMSPLPHDTMSPLPGDISSKSRVTIMSPGTTRVFESPVESSTRARAREQANIRFEENRFQGIGPQVRAAWVKAYPGVDFDREIAAAEVWWISNIRKRRRNILRFLSNWMRTASLDLAQLAPATPTLHNRCHCGAPGTVSNGKAWFCRAHNPDLL